MAWNFAQVWILWSSDETGLFVRKERFGDVNLFRFIIVQSCGIQIKSSKNWVCDAHYTGSSARWARFANLPPSSTSLCIMTESGRGLVSVVSFNKAVWLLLRVYSRKSICCALILVANAASRRTRTLAPMIVSYARDDVSASGTNSTR